MAAPRTVFELGNGTLEIFDLDPSETALYEMLKELFENWSRLALWDHLRRRWLGLADPDPFDRSGHGFQHG